MENILLLVAATAVLVSIPGPNVALTVATSLRHGVFHGLATVWGAVTGVALQLVLVILGLQAVLAVAADALTWLKWIGVAYLVYIGLKTWRSPPQDLYAPAGEKEPLLKSFSMGAFVSVLNPKTLLFNAAFLPQFVSGPEAGAGELLMLSAIYLTVIAIGDTLWASLASSARPLFRRMGGAYNKSAGAALVSAGAALALQHPKT